MTEANTWANQYEQLAAFTGKVNESANVIIKQKLLSERPELTNHPSFELTDEQIAQARTLLADLMVSLVGQQPGQAPPDEPTTELSGILIDNYRERLERNRPAQVQFGELRDRLQTDEPVTEREKQALDDIVLTLDNSRKQLFRTLRHYSG